MSSSEEDAAVTLKDNANKQEKEDKPIGPGGAHLTTHERVHAILCSLDCIRHLSRDSLSIIMQYHSENWFRLQDHMAEAGMAAEPGKEQLQGLPALLQRLSPSITHVQLGVSAERGAPARLFRLQSVVDYHIVQAHVSLVVDRFTKLVALDVEKCGKLTDASIQAVANKCTSLTYLNVAGCRKLTDAAIQAVASKCPNLQFLNVSQCKELTDAAILAVADGCPNLTFLNVSNIYLTNAAFEALGNKCTKLSSLSTYECWQVMDADIQAVVHGNLTSLNVGGCYSSQSRLTDASMQAVASKCPNLTFLDVKLCGKLTDAGIQTVASKCTRLTSLNVRGCEELTDASIQAVASMCPNITFLNVFSCGNLTDASILAVANKCTELTSLNVCMCWELTDASILAVTSKCTRLTSLDTDGLGCGKLTDVSMRAVAKIRTIRLKKLGLA